uniref:histone deacetylase n=1 Tax=Aplanochytrium stocchinoi TaxID=215587 RepID=A0A7S3PHC6_9STRA|mmetsp:Transcript_30699/g.37915  ORF Transcript_30699/g.37915 Transcript_30699/m.37915 type:complete len:354 (+) Transcript_30699:249-1310(+)|eukprot:CAMPEP_0204828234 /NCGR_PEP_ID=MMETSP1346-20131115/5898_1 /ASSEMBLY_ACC=CAM_ASM_000771 /TAXON_ID=215587 /ORGANISM="Aplanochytrium stocchinoi, Strain GSBS06" /LENGTH=353 /DNA_ID=CAMNT_0051957135 /DNA_START=173 /DNA_END=1234 /DNA_ORIENTATION=+
MNCEYDEGVEVAYIYSADLIKASDALPVHKRSADGKGRNRNAMVHSLIEGMGLLKCRNIRVVSPTPAKIEDALAYHDRKYIDALLHCKDKDTDPEILEKYSIGQDASAFEYVIEHSLWVLGGTLVACDQLMNSKAKVAINWCGGRHHALRAEASGFCYINDVVLAISKLQTKPAFQNILCIDIDVHHGDGQESAFYYTDSVMTVSFHLFEPGFFPGKSGDTISRGSLRGQGYNLNVPLDRGTSGSRYEQLFKQHMNEVLEGFSPDAIVFVCGADCLKNDPRGGLNLHHTNVTSCARYLNDLEKPMLVLGAGGYSFTHASKCWAAVTATILGVDTPDDIPEHEYFECYGPSWRF